MKKIKFYILFSEELNRPFTSFEDYTTNKTFSLTEKDSYKNELIKIRVFPTEKLAKIEQESVLNQFKTNNEYCMKNNIEESHTPEDFDLIKNLKIVEMINTD